MALVGHDPSLLEEVYPTDMKSDVVEQIHEDLASDSFLMDTSGDWDFSRSDISAEEALAIVNGGITHIEETIDLETFDAADEKAFESLLEEVSEGEMFGDEEPGG